MNLPDQILYSIRPYFISTAPLAGLLALSGYCKEACLLLDDALLPDEVRGRLVSNWRYLSEFCSELTDCWDLEYPDEAFRERRYYDYYTMLPALLCEHIPYTTQQLLTHCAQSDAPRRWQGIWTTTFD